jgi:putative ABC transport system permease protein
MMQQGFRKLITRLSLGPIFRAMRKQKFSISMLIVQVAITLAVTSNALFFANERYQHTQRLSGVDEKNMFALTNSGINGNFNPKSSVESDLRFLRQLPYVVDAVSASSFPFSDSGNWYDFQTEPGDNKNTMRAAAYKLDEHGIEAFGLNLIAGENFDSSDVQWLGDTDTNLPSPVIFSQAAAKSLFNTEDWSQIIGTTIYFETKHPVIVKGIIEHLQTPWIDWGPEKQSFLTPVIVADNSSRYIIRVKDGELQSSIPKIEQALSERNKNRIIRNFITLPSARDEIYGPDVAATKVLIIVIAVLVIVAAMGITGLTSFNVVKRKKQISIRRALGATKVDILFYFLFENIIQMTISIVLGSVLAVTFNVLLVNYYSLSQLPFSFIIYTAISIYILGILATLKPALKAMVFSNTSITHSL